jgi:hypothetical protein
MLPIRPSRRTFFVLAFQAQKSRLRKIRYFLILFRYLCSAILHTVYSRTHIRKFRLFMGGFSITASVSFICLFVLLYAFSFSVSCCLRKKLAVVQNVQTTERTNHQYNMYNNIYYIWECNDDINYLSFRAKTSMNFSLFFFICP